MSVKVLKTSLTRLCIFYSLTVSPSSSEHVHTRDYTHVFTESLLVLAKNWKYVQQQVNE